MGVLIRLPVLAAAYPDDVLRLERAECVVLLAIRWWVADRRLGLDPLLRLCDGLDAAGVEDAAFPVDRFMTVVARSAARQIDIGCPRCGRLFEDEKQILHAASLTQAGASALAERALRTALLSAPGAAFALGPLESLAELLTRARLRLRRRPHGERGGLATGTPAGAVEPWVPAAAPDTLH